MPRIGYSDHIIGVPRTALYPSRGIAAATLRRYSERMAEAPFTVRCWKRVEYDRLVEVGAFENEPIELIGGQLVVAEPKGPYHTSGVTAVDYALRAVLPPGWIVRNQAAVSLDDNSEPEPDLAVVPGAIRDYRYAHPTRPVLAIEVADSSLSFDRRHKGSLYARAGIADYWVVNLVDRVLEIYRDPAPDPSAVFGWAYRSVVSLAPPAVAVPLAFPSSPVTVADLLP
jgi:Uma2 family endonuclease